MKSLLISIIITLNCIIVSVSCFNHYPAPDQYHKHRSTNLDLLYATITDLKEALNDLQITPAQLVHQYLRRIQEVNREGPELNAVIETNPDAEKIAHKLQYGKGALNGIPILVKDIIDTADRLSTTAGSYALLGSKVPRDAFVIRQLRKAGAIILGKTSLSEWSGFRVFNISRQGVSARGGVSKSAYVTNGDPLGSSSGSAIAVSVGLCAAALGEETDGSIIGPASRNGIVGMKPTVGLTSRSGVIPISHIQDSIGPMAKTVEDVALLLEVIQGEDPRDNATVGVRRESCYTKYLKGVSGFKGVRVGVLRYDVITNATNPEQVKVFDEAVKLIRSHGALVKDPIRLKNSDELDLPAELIVAVGQFKENIENYLRQLKHTKIRTLRDIINFNNDHKSLEFNQYLSDQDIFLFAENTIVTSEDLANYARLAQSLEQTLEKHHLDILITLAEFGTRPSAIAGSPMITVPLGYLQVGDGTTDLQPFGLGIMGRKWSEGLLLKVAHAFEQATHVRDRVRPKYAPKDSY
ncbi:unnamed protein product [Didymodactylos carnosus]|uniref:Amidase domain-containing protein n=1 Tax=Didymodactylos carnosus TaxID=1234261 RepID=A0A815CL18_9BILA|nr:unnamed protein product [Didymodactylos carnosus]CAF1286602.1 unnamed protein product [Didymodactylos carnosus]CAF3605363.1 unnamed protein product [Didymodactylos carnosus]CAF4087917.1 unnamed protein product [Didymodactylos carnosus]